MVSYARYFESYSKLISGVHLVDGVLRGKFMVRLIMDSYLQMCTYLLHSPRRSS